MIRKPRRDMTRPQAAHGRGADWEMRWRSIWGQQRAEAKGLTGISAMNEHLKAVYGDAMPPGSPRRPRSSIASLLPDHHPLLDMLGAR